MKIDFYTDNEQKAATVSNYLFTDYYAFVMEGMIIERDFKEKYRVNSLHNDPKTMQLSHAFVWKYPDTK